MIGTDRKAKGSESVAETINRISSGSSGGNNVYNGFIKEPFSTRFNYALFSLFDYILQSTPPLYGLHRVISIWRILQFAGPALCINFDEFWGTNNNIRTTADIIATIFHIMPGFTRDEFGIYFIFAYIGISTLFYAIILLSTYIYSKKSQLPLVLPYMIYIITATLGHILQPCVVQIGGEIISRMIVKNDNVNTLNIVGVVLSFCYVIFFVIVYSKIYCVNIVFRPDSLMTVLPSNQASILIVTIIITFLIALSSKMTLLPTIIIIVITAIIYLLSILIFFTKGGFVELIYMKSMTATSVSGFVFMVIVLIYESLKMKASEVVLIIYVALWIICYLISSFFFRIRTARNLSRLDIVFDDFNYHSSNPAERSHVIKSVQQMCGCISTGFRNSHPICVNYQIFKIALETWPNSIDMWLLFAKFSCIYPEESQQLSYIVMGLHQNNIKNSVANQVVQQIKSIMKQREANLIPSLKVKLDHISKQVIALKAKIRYIWDLVLQGNINEIEGAVSRAYTATEQLKVQFVHLLQEFPNNRFLARAYTRFLRDVIADHEGHKKWAQNVSNLQRGVNIYPDQPHELGLAAFPNLPKFIENSMSRNLNNNNNNLTDDTLTQEIDGDDEHSLLDAEQRMSIKRSIFECKIPSYQKNKIIYIVLWFLLYMIPMILVTIFTPVYVTEISEPMYFVHTLSIMRTLYFQTAASLYHYVAENINFKYPSNHPDFPDQVVFPIEDMSFLEIESPNEKPPVSFDSSFKSREQLLSRIQRISTYISDLTKILQLKSGDVFLDQLKDLIFTSGVKLKHVGEPIYLDCWTDDDLDDSCKKQNMTFSDQSIQGASVQAVVDVRKILDERKVDKKIMHSPSMGNSINNLNSYTESISEAIFILLEYVESSQKSLMMMILISEIVIIILIVFIFAGLSFYFHHAIKNDKHLIYSCLTSMPKSVVSQVTETFRILKNANDDDMEEKSSRSRDEELNKQEENLLKLFTTASDRETSTADILVNYLFTIIFVILHVVIVVFMCDNYTTSTKQLRQTTPLIDKLMQAYSYDLAALLLVIMLPGSVYPYEITKIYGFSPQIIENSVENWLTLAQESLSDVMFGSESSASFRSIGISFDYQKEFFCNISLTPHNLHEAYDCWHANVLIGNVQTYIQKYLNVYQSNKIIFPGNDHLLKHLWHMQQSHIYETYYYPMIMQMSSKLDLAMNARVPSMNIAGYVIVFVALFFVMFYLFLFHFFEKQQIYALSLLLHFPGSVVMNNKLVLSVLSGDFSKRRIDNTTRDDRFYEALVNEMMDAIVITSLDGTIEIANKASERIFGIEKEKLIGGKLLTTIGDNFNGENPFKHHFDTPGNATGFESCCVYNLPGGEKDNKMYIEVVFTILNENLLVEARDITTRVCYNRLIHDEKAKSDKLLSAILPPKLVPRVQNGEKNISFAVQSVSIVFMDIVSFTPWCGSLPAATVMKTLNLLFKEFDSIASKQQTMTKIKCIGDCYMAAGGIFAEINQPAVHAKEVVEFGLDAIDKIIEINKKINENLKIRVGVNTGGPIVAGVLGTEKPTFEILGPTINMAQQMEHHGVPMRVHVSRAVYELIYGGPFKATERGQIDIKNGKIQTYLIDKGE